MALITFIIGMLAGMILPKFLPKDKEEEILLPPDVKRYLEDMNEYNKQI